MALNFGSEERLRSLLVTALDGDSKAYRVFLEQLAILLRGFLRKRLPRFPEDVEDLLQELLLTIHNQRHTYNRSVPVTAWVHSIARYKIVDLWRRRRRMEGLHEVFDDANELFGHSAHEEFETKMDLAALLAMLPDRQRLPIQYVKVEGASIADAAARTGMSISAVKVGIHRGLKLLSATIRKFE